MPENNLNGFEKFEGSPESGQIIIISADTSGDAFGEKRDRRVGFQVLHAASWSHSIANNFFDLTLA